MINLYSPTNTDFTHNGNATLQAISCELTVNINGAWQLELEIPYDKEERWKLIEEGAILQVDVDCIREISTRQRFRIYDYRKTEDSVVAIAFPVAMESTHDAPIDNLIIEDKSGIQAMAMLQAFTNKYTLYTDISKRGNASYSNTNVNNAIASGDTGSFIDEWGGEIVYDNLNYKVLEQIGSETDVEPVTYGRNITAIKYERDDSGVVTRLHPISQDGLRLNDNGHDYVDSPRILDYPIVKSRYIVVPYSIVDTREESPSRTAQFTREMITDLYSTTYQLSHTALANAVSNGYELEYIKKYKDDIINGVLELALRTITMESLQSVIGGAISDGMEWLKDVVKPQYDWHGSYSEGWWYGYNEEWKVKNNKTYNQAFEDKLSSLAGCYQAYDKFKWYLENRQA
jgi:phage minor structural protein